MIDIPAVTCYNPGMQITSRFTVAVHTLLAIHMFSRTQKTTSDFLAASVNANPVVIRRILSSLKAAGIVDVRAGSGGASLARPLSDITLYDVYRAVDSVEGDLFHFHERPNPDCPVGHNIRAVLAPHLDAAQRAMEEQLRQVTLSDLAHELDALL